ncbi:MAG TPA: class I SAM-dependent methyltransferase [Nitrososphaerales archaeon]|nr:class I SAM-dependent methyltransferase [Nitrososphaerales archaeon]
MKSADSSPAWGLFVSMLSPASGDRILDVGAGRGAIAARVLETSKGAEVFAVDPNEKRVASTKRNFPAVRSQVAAAEDLPFPDAYFDKVYTTMALHHFADMERSLREISRVLRGRGTFIIVEVDPHSAKGRLFRLFGGLTGEHMHLMTVKELTDRLGSSATLKVTRTAVQGSDYLVQLMRV